MSSKIMFSVGVSVTNMAGWLQYHTKHVRANPIEADGLRLGMRQAQSTGRLTPQGSGSTAMEMQGTISRFTEDGAIESVGAGIFPQAIIRFELLPLANDKTEVIAECASYLAEPYFLELLGKISERWGEARGPIARYAADLVCRSGIELPEALDVTDATSRGPTLKTQERAKLYKSLKDKHPTGSYAKIAMKANYQESVDYHTSDTVRNAFRAMGWTWERSNRIR